MAIDTGARSHGRAASRIGPTHTNTRAPVSRPARNYQRTMPTTNRAVTPPRRVPGLSARETRVASQVVGEGKKSHASVKALLSAIETGLVESHFHNLHGGDADSAGWRQERASIYPDPTNVSHSARRYFEEVLKAGGHTAGDLAANVQRPAAQYRSRYQQSKSQAIPILRALGIR